MRKRIAVLVAQIDEATQKKFLHGFTEKAYALDYDICIFYVSEVSGITNS